MSIDIVLVSGERLTLASVRDRFADPEVQTVLGPATIGGTPEEFPHITRVDTPRLNVDLYGPQESQTGEGVAPYTSDLGVMAPTDENGSSWWTQFDIVAGIEDTPAVEALFSVLASLAAAGNGHVVVQGELVDLPGVSPPTPLIASTAGRTAAEETADLAVGAAYLSVFLPFRAPDEGGWDRVLRLVRALTEDVPELWPGFIDVDGDWRAFTPTPQPPAWWPMAQRLGVVDPPATWQLVPAGFPRHSLTSVLMQATADADLTERLLSALQRTEEVSYAFLHHWTPAEQLPDSAVGLRNPGPDTPPWVLLSERRLRAALPGPYWVQVIGPEWEAVIGRDRLASTPAHRVDEIAPHRWLIQLTASASDLDGIQHARAAVLTHLGEDTFWSRGTPKQPRVDFGASADSH